MSKGKINKNKLFQMLADGKNLTECARHFGVSPAAVHKAKKGMAVVVAKDLHLASAHKFVDQHLNTVEQLRRINTRANELLEQAENDPRIALKCMSEIRAQLRLQNETLAMLAQMSAVIEFQQEIIQILKEIDPDAKNEFIRRLYKKRALWSAVKFGKD
jgi:hypothetical protein